MLDGIYGEKLLQVTYNPIVDPWYISTSILDEDQKELVRETFESLDATEKQKSWFKTAFRELAREHPPERKATYQNDFVRAEKALNEIRGTDTLAICPEVKRYFDRYDETNLTPDKGKGANPGAMFGGKAKPAASH